MDAVSYYSSEYSQSNYQYTQSLYKQKNNKDFILGNQTIFSISFVYALDYLEKEKAKIQRIYEIKGFPIIKYKDKTTEEKMLLIIPFVEGTLMQGIRSKTIRTEITLEEILDDAITFKKNKQIKIDLMLVDYYRETKEGLKQAILTPFGYLYFNGHKMVQLKV